MKIYYEYDPVMGVNVTYDLDGNRYYDYFSSLYTFNVWCSSEFFNAEQLEITNLNYRLLAEKGVI